MNGIREFDEAVRVAAEWFEAFVARLGWHDRERAYRALRAAAHALRDCLPVDEVAALGTQLPTLLRGEYYEGWRPTGRAFRIRTREAFLERIREGVHRDPAVDAEQVARALLALLAARLPPAEIEDAKAVTPAELRGLWPD
ncbi:DUF2267 domain-containing protein [Caldovatus aquaticus]|uniref:DUF2267 domain-containing protein n=1 Tax=Caldovatus aquaticus TaxID=2865671 RepID=A0ABS7F2R5_9PROT|nr:DUF2267 domain-containing protein [Caldovatus aquaticus]